MASSIDGKVSSQIQGANLFFLNPAGLMFGPHAQLDVSGSVAVTTANYVKLVGGGQFNAKLGGQDTLTSAPVSSFGFLNSAPAAVSVTGSNLNIAPQKSFSVVAGDIAMGWQRDIWTGVAHQLGERSLSRRSAAGHHRFGQRYRCKSVQRDG